MKTKYLSILIVIITIAFESCQDEFLDIQPRVNKMEANAYITEEDAFLALVSVYDVLSHQEVLNFQPLRADIFSDDAMAAGDGAGMSSRWQKWEQSTLDAESPTAEEEWGRCYKGVYRASQYLKKEPEIAWKTDAKSIEKRKRMKAEVKFLLAYFYWDLERHFGWVPIVNDLITSQEAKTLKQSEPTEVYQYIAKNLLEALSDLPETVTPNEYGRITKAAAQVLMARIYQFHEDFGKKILGITSDWSDGTTTITKKMVIENLEEIITNGHYTLLSNYNDIHDWDNQNNKESILEIQFANNPDLSFWDKTEYNNGNTMCYIVGPRSPMGDSSIVAGWSFGQPTWTLYNEFEPGDPRLDATIYNADVKLTSYFSAFQNTGFFNRKYMARSKYSATTSDGVHKYPKNFIDMRLAEVYLILAELYLTSDNAKATFYLNQVRTRAMGPSAAKSSITLDDVYHEKRVEFACEGLRYWDLLRRGLDYAKEKIDASYIPDPSCKSPGDFIGFVFNKESLGMLPIPASEIRNANKGVLEQKIPYYQSY